MIIWNLDYLLKWANMSCCSKRHLLQSSPPGPMLWSSSWASSAQQRQSEITFQLFDMLCFYMIFTCSYFPPPRCIESESEPPTKSTEKFLQYSCYIGERSSLSIRLLLQTLLCSISNAISPQTRTWSTSTLGWWADCRKISRNTGRHEFPALTVRPAFSML